jgi:hypothetical protein
MSKPAAKRGGGRPIGPLMKKIKHFDRPSKRKLIETDADQLRIKREIDGRYAGVPDLGRVIPKGSEEFESIAAELLARENAGVADMAVKFCTVAGCKKMAQWGKDGMCTAHHSAAKAAAFVAAVDEPVAVAAEPEPHEVTPVEYAAVFGVDPLIVAALNDAWQAKEAEWLVELAGIKPGLAIRYAAGMVKAVEGLGY